MDKEALELFAVTWFLLPGSVARVIRRDAGLRYVTSHGVLVLRIFEHDECHDHGVRCGREGPARGGSSSHYREARWRSAELQERPDAPCGYVFRPYLDRKANRDVILRLSLIHI